MKLCCLIDVRVVARMISNLPSQFRQQEELIRPIVEERFAKMEEFGENWDDKPVRRSTSLDIRVIINAEKQNDMLMWLMSEAKGAERSVEGFARRLLIINFAAIFTTSLVSRTNLVMGH
jgi:ATP phosphoribosyltransferase regulatory subunit HisZ